MPGAVVVIRAFRVVSAVGSMTATLTGVIVAGVGASERGELLYRLVADYSGLGDHRTGTEGDEATRAWFASELERRGAAVDELAYDFPKFDADVHVEIDGCEVESCALWYSGAGAVSTDRPRVATAHAHLGPGVDDALRDARAEKASALVLATDGGGGRLVAVNRAAADPPGPPAALVPGALSADIAGGDVTVTIDACIAPGSSATVVGTFGDPVGRPAVVATPLSGWFTCAGERGTGIAVALEVAAALAEGGPVVVVGSTGHELWHLGVRDYLRRIAFVPGAVLHLGAGVAAGEPGVDGDMPLGDTRVALVREVPADAGASLRSALAPAGCTVIDDIPQWPGEGREWQMLDTPLLSVIGAFERFHTRDDVPAQATTPQLLERVYGSVLAAAGVLFAR